MQRGARCRGQSKGGGVTRFEIPAEYSADVWTSAPILVRTHHTFRAPAAEVFAALDSDEAWRWLGPCVGVEYLQPAEGGSTRGVGMVREMGSVRRPLRWVWRQRERFVRYEVNRRLTFYAFAGSWPLLRLWAEDYQIESTGPNSAALTWTVAWAPMVLDRLPLHWTQPVMRLVFTVSFRYGLRRLIRQRAKRGTEQTQLNRLEPEGDRSL